MKLIKQPSKRALTMAVLALEEYFEGLTVESLAGRLVAVPGEDLLPELLSVREVAEKLDCHPQTVRELIKSGTLKTANSINNQRGRHEYRVLKASLHQYIHNNKGTN